MKIIRDGEPCTHKGCLSHRTHPCEGCGRVVGKGEVEIKSIEEAMSVFTNSREMTEEESKAYKKVLDDLYKPTGRTRNFY